MVVDRDGLILRVMPEAGSDAEELADLAMKEPACRRNTSTRYVLGSAMTPLTPARRLCLGTG
ncbi:MAG: hypothetical protein ACRDPD_16415, partial [Streptosporangiaceae bacterium]